MSAPGATCRCCLQRDLHTARTLLAVAAAPEPSRIARQADATEAAELLDRFQTEFDECTPGAEVLIPRVRAHITNDRSVFLLAGPPQVGVAQLRFRDYLLTATPMCYLEELYVVPHHRGLGHGRMLLQTALDLARARGAISMELGTAANDTAARGLYDSLGFTNLEKARTARDPDAVLRARPVNHERSTCQPCSATRIRGGVAP